MSLSKGNYILYYMKNGKPNYQLHLGFNNNDIKQEAKHKSKILNVKVYIFKLLGSQEGDMYISQPRM